MITLAIDTCDARGSVAVRRDGGVVALKRHLEGVEYSAWLIPAVEEVLAKSGTKMEDIGLLAVATGPGSFTGTRIGLTTVKAWAEVYGKPVVGVSRLEAIARSQETGPGFVAACYDAHRGQLFAGLYRSVNGRRVRVGEERVISPEELVALVDAEAGEEKVTWITLDPDLMNNLDPLKQRLALGDNLCVCSPELAGPIGALAEERAARGEFTDPLALDANYVRRSDAEIFWKGPSTHVR